MYSGSDSTESQNRNQWPLNPAAYQNTPNEQIDWAALAQQWIIMKEAGPPVPEQIANPIPLALNNQKLAKAEVLSEGGEAPMEVENEKDDDGPQPQWNNDSSIPEGSWNWNQQWGWGNSWPAPTGIPPPSKAPLLPTPIPYNQFSNTTDNATNFAGTTSNEYSSSYWPSVGSNKIKSHNKRFNKVNLPARPPIPTTLPDPVTLDASKRKQLPAWIREGLEKMERDKQKQMEKEREKQERVEIVENSKLNEKEAMEIIKLTVKEREKSKFDSDAEDSENSVLKEKPLRIIDPVILTQDDLMMKLRRTMTEILLKVTNQEIRAVCKEEYQRYLRKNKASDQRVSASSGTNVTGNLGLGIYGDSGSSSDEDDNSDHNKNDSDNELKNVIRKKKAEFAKTEREIEDRLSAANKFSNSDSRGGTPTADDCDSQVDAKRQGLKLKSHQEEPSVKVVSKRLTSRRDSTSSFSKSDSDQDKRGRSKERRRSKRSSSSESDYKRSKNKYSKRSKRSRSAGRSKDKRRSSERKFKVSESGSSKSSSLRSRKSRSKSIDSVKKKKRSVVEKSRKGHKRSHSRSSSRSRRSRSYKNRRRSISRSSVKSDNKRRKSRSRTRSSKYSDLKSRRSRSYNRRSRSTDHSSWRRTKSPSPSNRRRRRSWSNESGRGNRRRH